MPTTQQLLGEFQQCEIFPTTEPGSLAVLIHVYILSIRQDLLSPRGYYRFYLLVLYHDVSLHLCLHLWIYFDHLVASKINQESSETLSVTASLRVSKASEEWATPTASRLVTSQEVDSDGWMMV